MYNITNEGLLLSLIVCIYLSDRFCNLSSLNFLISGTGLTVFLAKIYDI